MPALTEVTDFARGRFHRSPQPGDNGEHGRSTSASADRTGSMGWTKRVATAGCHAVGERACRPTAGIQPRHRSATGRFEPDQDVVLTASGANFQSPSPAVTVASPGPQNLASESLWSVSRARGSRSFAMLAVRRGSGRAGRDVMAQDPATCQQTHVFSGLSYRGAVLPCLW